MAHFSEGTGPLHACPRLGHCAVGGVPLTHLHHVLLLRCRVQEAELQKRKYQATIAKKPYDVVYLPILVIYITCLNGSLVSVSKCLAIPRALRVRLLGGTNQ